MNLFRELNKIRYCIAPNTYRTIRGQIMSGDKAGASAGIKRLRIKAEKEQAELLMIIEELDRICKQYEEQGIDHLQTICYRKAEKYMEELYALKGGRIYGEVTGN